ncbi:putative amidase signature domain-containing protein [Septoria linicola]|nr:putative amidase signature domain-containing protein [Septoria linicola]
MAAKLRKAGAIILGKTNLSQWANYRSDNTSNGWSAYGGQTYAAYYSRQDPSGSSSGSGVASSIGLALASLGSETSGSILSPSNVNGLVGIKPTVGLTSRYLVIPISEHQDTVGPMARTVRDAAHVLKSIAGPDPKDNYTSAYPFKTVPDYVAACKDKALSGARIGVAWNVLDIWAAYTDQPVLDAFYESVKAIEAAGATIVSANFSGFAAWQNDSVGDTVLSADFQVGLANYLSQLSYNPQNITTLAEEQAWTHGNGHLEHWPERDTAIWDTFLANQTWNNTDPRFWQAYQKNLYYGGEGGILGALRRTNTSAVLLPTQLSPSIPALVGSPVVTVPMGFYPYDWNVTMNGFGNLVASGPNIPFGLSFMGDMWSEETLIGYAYAYEQRTMHRTRVKPYIRPNVEIADVVAV